MQIRTLGSKIGVEVSGVDVKNMRPEEWDQIYRAFLDYNVLVVRDQQLTEEEYIAYSERFGPVTPHPSKSTRNPKYPKITMLGYDKFDSEGKLRPEIYARGAGGWHIDGAFNEVALKATQLYGVAIPSRGGNTLFACGYAAYDALPDELKARYAPLVGLYSYGGRSGRAAKLLNSEDRDWKPVRHPLIRVHPETGRKSIYFDPEKLMGFEGIEEAEGDRILDDLIARMIVPGATYEHVWSKGDIVIVDDRCSYHAATADYPPEEDRFHWRVSINEYGFVPPKEDEAA